MEEFNVRNIKGKTTKHLLYSEDYCKAFGTAFLFFIDTLEEKNAGPDACSIWYFEHPSDPQSLFEVQVTKMPRNHPDIRQDILEPSKFVKERFQ